MKGILPGSVMHVKPSPTTHLAQISPAVQTKDSAVVVSTVHVAPTSRSAVAVKRNYKLLVNYASKRHRRVKLEITTTCPYYMVHTNEVVGLHQNSNSCYTCLTLPFVIVIVILTCLMHTKSQFWMPIVVCWTQAHLTITITATIERRRADLIGELAKLTITIIRYCNVNTTVVIIMYILLHKKSLLHRSSVLVVPGVAAEMGCLTQYGVCIVSVF